MMRIPAFYYWDEDKDYDVIHLKSVKPMKILSFPYSLSLKRRTIKNKWIIPKYENWLLHWIEAQRNANISPRLFTQIQTLRYFKVSEAGKYNSLIGNVIKPYRVCCPSGGNLNPPESRAARHITNYNSNDTKRKRHKTRINQVAMLA